MVAKLIISGDFELRKKTLNEILNQEGLSIPHADVLYFDSEQKLGVEQTKEIREFLSIKPFQGEKRAIILESAHDLTPEAQNSLLKTLEEPPEYAIILLGGEGESQFLPTVLSRCEVVRIENGQLRMDNGDWEEKIDKLVNSSIEEKFAFVEKLEEKEEFLEALIYFFREKMHQDPKYGKLVSELLQAQEWSKSNVNMRGILEYIMLRI